MRFIKETWPWIVVPALALALAAAFLYWDGGGGFSDGSGYTLR